MPIYEYSCKQCGHHFEELVSIHQQDVLPCPKCKSSDTKKELSVIGAIQMGKPVDSSSCGEGAKNSSCPSGSTCADAGSCPMAGE